MKMSGKQKEHCSIRMHALRWDLLGISLFLPLYVKGITQEYRGFSTVLSPVRAGIASQQHVDPKSASPTFLPHFLLLCVGRQLLYRLVQKRRANAQRTRAVSAFRSSDQFIFNFGRIFESNLETSTSCVGAKLAN